MMDDRELIERFKGLLAKATRGPWSYRSREFDDWGIVRAAEDASGHMPIICQARDPYCLDGDDLAIHRANKTDPWEGNARLIAEAVTELPGLLDRLQALSAEVLQLRQENAELQEPSPYCDQCGSCGEQGCGCTHKCKYAFEHPDVAAEIETLRAALRRIEGGDDNWQLVATQALKGANNG